MLSRLHEVDFNPSRLAGTWLFLRLASVEEKGREFLQGRGSDLVYVPLQKGKRRFL